MSETQTAETDITGGTRIILITTHGEQPSAYIFYTADELLARLREADADGRFGTIIETDSLSTADDVDRAITRLGEAQGTYAARFASLSEAYETLMSTSNEHCNAHNHGEMGKCLASAREVMRVAILAGDAYECDECDAHCFGQAVVCDECGESDCPGCAAAHDCLHGA